MGTITCLCGNWLKIATDGAAQYTADYLPSSLLGQCNEIVEQRLTSLISAIQKGQTVDEWMGWNDGFSATVAGKALLSWQVVGEPLNDYSRDIIQCSRCNRLLVQRGSTAHYTTFLPEQPESARNILSADKWIDPDDSAEPTK